jgi:glycosyltransferase involved in cell wall biosynthesis
VPLTRLRRLPGADFRNYFGRWLDAGAVQTLDKSFKFVDAAAAALVKPETSAVIGREDACLLSFRRAKALNIPRIYQLPTAHFATVRALLKCERNVFPNAFDTGDLEADFAPARIQRKAAELDSATHILCPSSFVAESLKSSGIPGGRITVLPFGTGDNFASDLSGARDPIFLYAGTISARKGVHRLIRMWKQLRAYRTHRLRLIGEMRLPARFLADYRAVFEHIPRLPRASLVNQYARAQAFVFNALADGFGHVFLEAMACGTAVLASRNSGAPDLINNGKEGWLFEYGDDEALGAALDRALSSPQTLLEMGERGRRRALRWTCDDFAASFLNWITAIIEREAPRDKGSGNSFLC